MSFGRLCLLPVGVLSLLLTACGGSVNEEPLNDDDTPKYSFDSSVLAVEEGDAGQRTVTLSLALDRAADRDYTISYNFAAHAAGSAPATVGVDFLASSGEIEIATGDSSASVNLVVLGDTEIEANETLLLNVSEPALGSAELMVTIHDDDRPALSVVDASVSEGDSGSAATLDFVINLSPVASADVSVDYATSDGSAVAGSDYQSQSGSLIFAAGETSKAVSVPVIGDTQIESDESLSLTLSGVSENARIARAAASGVIVDDDLPGVSVSDLSLSESNSPFSFRVSLSDPLGEAVTLDYRTEAGTATGSDDFQSVSGTLTIAAGEQQANIDVTVIDDSVVEADEQFSLQLSNISANARLVNASASATILNDDAAATAPVLASIGSQQLLAGENSTLSLSATDSNPSSLTFSATLPVFASLSDNGDGTASISFSPTLAQLGQYSATVRVSDGAEEDSETFTIEVVTTEVVINEIMASNGSTLADGDGAFEDWIELHNRGGATAQLQGWCLSDDPTNPAMWCFPETELPAGGYLVVFASKKAGSATAGELHAGLKLSKGGEPLGLYKPDGSVVSEFSAGFPQQATDISWGRDSRGELNYMVQPTPGAANGEGVPDVLLLDQSSLSFSALTGVDAGSSQVGLSALSGGSLAYSINVDDGGAGWLSVAALPGDDDLTPDTLQIGATAVALAGGSYQGTVTVSAAGYGSTSLSVSFTVAHDNGASANVEISEIMAVNVANLADGDGAFEDWIELHNLGAAPVNLAGWCLSDDSALPRKWCFPSVEVAADGYLLVFASNKAGSAVAGELHAGLRLSQAGEYLGLYKPDNSVADAFTPTFAVQSEDVSWGRDASGSLGYFSTPTPGAANGAISADALRFGSNPLVIAANAGDAGTPLLIDLSTLGNATVAYSLSVDDGGLGWLSAATAIGGSGSTVDQISVQADASALSAGNYTGRVTASAPGQASSVLTVNFNVSGVSATQGDVVISEFMASNISNLTTSSGVFEDWIELHNQGITGVDLTGWCLTDDPAQPQMWCFDDGPQLAADERQLVFASGGAAPAAVRAVSTEIHAGLKLAKDGEYLALMRPDGSIATQLLPSYPAQHDDVSYGVDGAGLWGYFSKPTPGAANDAQANQPPVLTAIAAQSVNADSVLEVALSASDANGDSLQLSLSGQPQFASLVDNGDGSGALRLAPQTGQEGNYAFSVQVSDGLSLASQPVSLTVNAAPNQPPQLAAIAAPSLPAGTELDVALSASDADGDPLSFSLSNQPGFVALVDNGDGSGLIRLMPLAVHEGQHSFTVSVSDGRDSANQQLTVTVEEAINTPPQIVAIADQSLAADESLQLALSASDADGDALSFSASGLPSFVSLTDNGDGSASLSINPAPVNGGSSATITVSVSDGRASASTDFQLDVTLANRAPQLAVVSDLNMTAGESLAINLYASDADADALSFSAIGLPAWASLNDLGNGSAQLQLDPSEGDAGAAVTVGLSVSDGALQDDASLAINVSDAATPNYQLVFSSNNDRVGAQLLDGARISGDLYARVEPEAGVAQVQFFLDGAASPLKSEGSAPYDLQGGGAHANPWDSTQVDSGSHSIETRISLSGGGEQVLTSTFIVANGGAVQLQAIADQQLMAGYSLALAVSATTESGLPLALSVSGPAFASMTDNGDGTGSLRLAPTVADIGNHRVTVTATDGLDTASLDVDVEVVASLASLRINEFLASNISTLNDADGDTSDWIELFNASADTLDLEGWCLTDDNTLPEKWCFPAGESVDAGEYLIVFASGKLLPPANEHHTNFKLTAIGEYLALLNPDGVAVSELSPEYPEQVADASYGLNAAGDWVYFSQPTPGAVNGEGTQEAPDRVSFSHERGFYSAPFQLTLTPDPSLDEMRFTTDGSEPTLTNGSSYSAPIEITTTTVVRVLGFSGGVQKGSVYSHSYLFLDDVIRQPYSVPGYPNVTHDDGRKHDFEMDPVVVAAYSDEIIDSLRSVPTMSLSVDPALIFGNTGFYTTKDLKIATSVEVIYPDEPADSHQVDGAVESHSHYRSKRSLRLSFSSTFGASKMETDLLNRAANHGTSAIGLYDKIVLRGGNNRCFCRQYNPDKTTYTVDQFYRDTQIAASGDSARGNYVHLYINGLYWGLYNATERPDKHFLSDYFGGDAKHWFSANHGVVHDDAPALSGDTWRFYYLTGLLQPEGTAPVTPLVDRDMSDSANYAELQQYLNVDQFIDYLLVSWWSATNDWPDNNWYSGSRNDSSKLGTSGLMFFAWDGEASWNAPQDFSNPEGQAKIHPAFGGSRKASNTGDSFIIAKIWHAARRNPAFMDRVHARVEALTGPGGALNDDEAIERWDTLADHVRSAVVAESARWGDTVGRTRTRDVDWQDAVDEIRGFLNGNADALKQALRDEGYLP